MNNKCFLGIDTPITASFNYWTIIRSGYGVSARASTRTGILDTIGARWRRVGPAWTLATKLTPVHEPSLSRKPRRWPIISWPIKRISGTSNGYGDRFKFRILISGNGNGMMGKIKFFKDLSDVALLFANVARTVGIHVFETVRLYGIDERS